MFLLIVKDIERNIDVTEKRWLTVSSTRPNGGIEPATWNVLTGDGAHNLGARDSAPTNYTTNSGLDVFFRNSQYYLICDISQARMSCFCLITQPQYFYFLWHRNDLWINSCYFSTFHKIQHLDLAPRYHPFRDCQSRVPTAETGLLLYQNKEDLTTRIEVCLLPCHTKKQMDRPAPNSQAQKMKLRWS